MAEPNEIHLGVGKTARNGRGIGREQEGQVVQALTNSTAAKTGAIQAIEELELHIPGIGPDKISDLVANIVLADLAGFTGEMCELWNIYPSVFGQWILEFGQSRMGRGIFQLAGTG